MQTVTTVGLDIAKSVFQVHGIDAKGDVIIRRQLKRRYVLGAIVEKDRRSILLRVRPDRPVLVGGLRGERGVLAGRGVDHPEIVGAALRIVHHGDGDATAVRRQFHIAVIRHVAEDADLLSSAVEPGELGTAESRAGLQGNRPCDRDEAKRGQDAKGRAVDSQRPLHQRRIRTASQAYIG